MAEICAECKHIHSMPDVCGAVIGAPRSWAPRCACRIPVPVCGVTEREVILAALKRVYGEPKQENAEYDPKDTFSAGWKQEFAESVKDANISVFDGYTNFVSSFEFDAEGKLTRCSAWE